MREHRAEGEQQQRHDERVEVPVAAVAERVLRVASRCDVRWPEQQQALVGGVGDRVHGLGQHRRRPGEQRIRRTWRPRCRRWPTTRRQWLWSAALLTCDKTLISGRINPGSRPEHSWPRQARSGTRPGHCRRRRRPARPTRPSRSEQLDAIATAQRHRARRRRSAPAARRGRCRTGSAHPRTTPAGTTRTPARRRVDEDVRRDLVRRAAPASAPWRSPAPAAVPARRRAWGSGRSAARCRSWPGSRRRCRAGRRAGCRRAGRWPRRGRSTSRLSSSAASTPGVAGVALAQLQDGPALEVNCRAPARAARTRRPPAGSSVVEDGGGQRDQRGEQRAQAVGVGLPGEQARRSGRSRARPGP